MHQQADNSSKYRIISKLCSGGMADIFLGVQLDQQVLDRLVVVKKIHSARDSDGDTSKMFADEARIVSTLSHPHVVQIFDFTDVGDNFHIVMEYIDGENLGYVLNDFRKRGLRIPPPVALRLMEQALEAIQYIHTAVSRTGEPLNIVHRDLDPRNLMLDSNGYLKVIDFGVAKAVLQTELTAPGLFKGKLSHVAPEIFTKSDVDRRVDIYSMGLVLFELLTGDKPYRFGKSAVLADTIRRIVEEPLRKPSDVLEGIPDVLDDIVAKACAKDREARFQSAEEFRAALTEAAYGSKPRIGIASNAEVKDWLHRHFAERLAKRRRFESVTLLKARQVLSGIRPTRPSSGPRPSTDPERSGSMPVPSEEEYGGESSLIGPGSVSGVSFSRSRSGKDRISEMSFSRYGASSVPPPASIRLDGNDSESLPRSSTGQFIKVTAVTASAAITVFAAVFLYLGIDFPWFSEEKGAAPTAEGNPGTVAAIAPHMSTDENDNLVREAMGGASEESASAKDTPGNRENDGDDDDNVLEKPERASLYGGGATPRKRWSYKSSGWRKKNSSSTVSAAADDPEEETVVSANDEEELESSVLEDEEPAPEEPSIDPFDVGEAAPLPSEAAGTVAVDTRRRPAASEALAEEAPVAWISGNGNWSGAAVAIKGCGNCHGTPDAGSKTASQWEYFFSHNRHRRNGDLKQLFSIGELERVQSYLVSKREKMNAKSSGIAGVR